jgi:mannose-6-phosphate isomerase-like protein (cupin superfamily)
VCCIRGAVRLILRPSDPDETSDEEIRLLPGQAVIVPRGRWHRLKVDEPTDLVAITFPDGTQLEKVEPASADDEVAIERPGQPDKPAVVGIGAGQSHA